MEQVLIRISPRDFSFIAEDSLETIFGYVYKHGVKINLMQNSAISFQIDDLEKDFKISYETGLELITIRYFDSSTIDRVMINKELILRQTYKQNIQLVFVYRYQPPFGTVQLAYQKGTGDIGEESDQGHTLFVKVSYVF